jgi:hypothetical protein
MRTSIVMEPRRVLRERLMALTRLRIVQIQESANLNHNHARGTGSRRLLVLQHHPEGPQDLQKKPFPTTHNSNLSTCRDVSSV